MARQKIEDFNIAYSSDYGSKRYFKQKELIERFNDLIYNFSESMYPLDRATIVYRLPDKCLWYFQKYMVSERTLKKIEKYLDLEFERCEKLKNDLGDRYI